MDVEGRVLDWDEPELPSWVFADGAVDLVLLADVACTYTKSPPFDRDSNTTLTDNTAYIPVLLRTLRSLLRPRPCSTSPPPFALFAYKLRDTQEKIFWELAEEDGDEKLELKLVGLTGRGGEGQIWVIRWVGRD